jgi:hypothetical protein
MGMGEWDCVLVQKGGTQAKLQSALSNAGVIGETSTHEAAGTFSAGDRVTITYAPKSLADPQVLVALFAHELSHYLLAATSEAPTCEASEKEPLTDLTAVFEGFGLFSCHAAFQFRQWTGVATQGWSVSRLGYLTDAEFAFAIALFCIRNETYPALAAKYLRPNPREVFADALDYIDELDKSEQSPSGQ